MPALIKCILHPTQIKEDAIKISVFQLNTYQISTCPRRGVDHRRYEVLEHAPVPGLEQRRTSRKALL
jgi:hypothetical protein